ncbi:MAG TPA: hypothetical protein VNN72_06980 [Polyangiaceae bacterium]|nr:hypothetical protein [Polyangiaceae bacterium]
MALFIGFGVKITILLSGLVSIVLGYKLFTRGVYRGGAGVRVEGWKAVVAMDKGGPGLVFALFGAIVLIVGIIHPVNATHERNEAVPASSGTPTPASGGLVRRSAEVVSERDQSQLENVPAPRSAMLKEALRTQTCPEQELVSRLHPTDDH